MSTLLVPSGQGVVETPMQLVPGSMVERYIVEARLGAGRMSTTYRARHSVLDTLHALTLPNHPSEALRRRLIKGARVQARLRHPAVVAITDVLDHDGVPAIVLDHVDGPTLEDFIASNNFDENGIDAIAGGLIDAVGWLHRNGVVHRNLKPRNVIVDLGGDEATPRITDFTLARVLGQPQRKRKKPRVFGTASYMSPEQTIDSDNVGTQSDLWALGALLYLLITKKPAFPDDELVFQAVRNGQYVPLRRRVPSAPLRWVDAISECLTVPLKERTLSAEVMADTFFAGSSKRSKMSSKTAPVGKLALVFTDVQGSTQLWEKKTETARHSLKAHDAVMRASLQRHGGYEVKTEGDAFMVAFQDPAKALDFCLDVQLSLHEHPWSDELLAMQEAREELGFCGLRVRMGIHIGEPEVRAHNGSVDYFGPMVNRSARIAHAGHGGQILISQEAWDKAQGKLTINPNPTRLGAFRMRGLDGTQEIIQVLPDGLTERTFPPVRAEAP